MFEKDKKSQNIWQFGQKCKQYFEKCQVIVCDYRVINC